MRKLLYVFGCWTLILNICLLQECIDISDNTELLNNLLSKSREFKLDSSRTFEVQTNGSPKYYKFFILDSSRLVKKMEAQSENWRKNYNPKMFTYVKTILEKLDKLVYFENLLSLKSNQKNAVDSTIERLYDVFIYNQEIDAKYTEKLFDENWSKLSQIPIFKKIHEDVSYLFRKFGHFSSIFFSWIKVYQEYVGAKEFESLVAKFEPIMNLIVADVYQIGPSNTEAIIDQLSN